MNPVMPAKLHRIDHFCSHTKCMRSIPCKYHHLDLDNTHTQREREREREPRQLGNKPFTNAGDFN